MLKNLTLAILICSSTNIHSMDIFYASTKYILSLFQSSQEPQHIQLIQKNINKFKNQLENNNRFIFYNKEQMDSMLQTFFAHSTYNNPEYFLIYCYYLQEYQFLVSLHTIKALRDENNKKLLENYQITQINGFSALGAAALAIYLPSKKQKLLITALRELNFRPTDQDKTIIQLKFNDTLTTKYKAIAPFLLCTTQSTIFTTLPPEINKIIMNNVINTEKNQLSNDFYPF